MLESTLNSLNVVASHSNVNLGVLWVFYSKATTSALFKSLPTTTYFGEVTSSDAYANIIVVKEGPV
jgi:hypothetical protein